MHRIMEEFPASTKGVAREGDPLKGSKDINGAESAPHREENRCQCTRGKKTKEGQVSGNSPEERVTTWFTHFKNLLGNTPDV